MPLGHPRAARRVTLLFSAVAAFSAVWWCGARPRSGLLVVWTDVRSGGALQVALDGAPFGTLTEFFTLGAPPCDTGRGVAAGVFLAGPHQLKAFDRDGRRWEFPVLVEAGGCTLVRLGDLHP